VVVTRCRGLVRLFFFAHQNARTIVRNELLESVRREFSFEFVKHIDLVMGTEEGKRGEVR
jgi:hypothetical protein